MRLRRAFSIQVGCRSSVCVGAVRVCARFFNEDQTHTYEELCVCVCRQARKV